MTRIAETVPPEAAAARAARRWSPRRGPAAAATFSPSPSSSAAAAAASPRILAAIGCLVLASTFLLLGDDSPPLSSAFFSPGAGRLRRLTDGSATAAAAAAAAVAGRRRRPSSRPLRILALGGSVTWGGGCLDDPAGSAYPHVLGRLLSPSSSSDSDAASASAAVVHNLAIRGAGSFFPSMCVRSMVADARGGGGREAAGAAAGRPEDAEAGDSAAEGADREGDGGHVGVEGAEEDGDVEEEDYDVILLEFNMNGRAGLPLLVRRLRRRYPSALIVYVNLRSLAHTGGRRRAERRTVPPSVMALMDSVGGRVWDYDRLPRSYPHRREGDERDWDEAGAMFCDDMHHLGPGGHEHVARELAAVVDAELKKQRAAEEGASDESAPRPAGGGEGTWGLSDRCFLWYHTGVVPPGLVASGGRMNLFNAEHRKYAYELADGGGAGGGGGGELTFEFDVPDAPPAAAAMEMPVYVTHMTFGAPEMYPAVDVVVAAAAPGDERDSRTTGTETTTSHRSRIDPSSPRHERWGGLHLTEMSSAGTVRPGRKVSISIAAADGGGEEERTPANPFRVVGLSVCGACVEMGYGDYAGGIDGCRKQKCFV